jgi:hypothetical protein
MEEGTCNPNVLKELIMSRIICTVLPSWLLCATSAFGASPTIQVAWSGGTPQSPNDYEIDDISNPDFPDIELKAGGTWTIWSTDPDNPGNIGDIGHITCPNPADFVVRIRNNANSGPGARHVSSAVLAPTSNNHSSVALAEITGNLTGDLTVTPDSGGSGGTLDDVTIGGDVSGDITAKSVAKLLIDGSLTNTGSLSIADDVVDTGAEYILIRYMDGGSITCSGDLDLRTEDGGDWLVVGHGLSNADLPVTTHTGAINVGGVLTGRIYIRGYSELTIDVDEIDAGDDCGQGCTGACNACVDEYWRPGGIEASSGFSSGSDITIGTFTSGRIGLPAEVLNDSGDELYVIDFGGSITIINDMAADATIDTLQADTDHVQRFVDWTGTLTVGGEMAGTFRCTGDSDGVIVVDEDLSGLILIDHSLLDATASSDPEIEVVGEITATGAITVNYNFDPLAEWESGATVEADGTPYSGNDETVHVYNVYPCKGDMTNDESVDFGDIDPFLLALFDPEQFGLDFPGLGASAPGPLRTQGGGSTPRWASVGPMIYHGDFAGGEGGGCNGQVDNFDSDPFVEALFEAPECCVEECGPVECESFGPGGPDAEEVADALSNHADPGRLDAFAAVIAALAPSMDPARQVLWEDVLGILGYE